MRRTIPVLNNAGVAGTPFAAFLSPRVGYTWRVYTIAISVPNWITGILPATITLDGQFVCKTEQGFRDTAEDQAGLIVRQSQQLGCVWSPSANSLPATGIEGHMNITVDEDRNDEFRAV